MSSAASNLSAVFIAVLAATTLMRIWLGLRQVEHVSRHRETVPAAFREVIELAAHQKAADYTVARVRLGLLDVAVSALLVAWFTIGGGLQWAFDLWSGVLHPGGYAHALAFIGTVSAIGFVAGLPFVLWRTFVIEERFGFNKMTPALFVADLLKETLLALLIGAPVLAAVLWLMAHMGSLWWLYVWLFWLGFNLLVLLIYPSFIAPLFNKFSPLSDDSLRQRVEALLARCGFRASGLFVMDGSKRSAHGNAYFTGFGAAKRIVFFDTLLAKLSALEIEAVLAHELGHYKHHHVWQRLGAMGLASLAFLALLGYLIERPWFFHGLGMTSEGTASALVLFMIAIPVFVFPLSPLMSGWSRKHEFQADAYAARQTRREDLVTALVKLYRDNASTLTPDPLYSAFRDSHPPAAARIAHLQAAATQPAALVAHA
ncbi:MAG: M48 family metallopeptidase [Sterolibacteriaceae bacterium]|nr:M48 family metallopeptidase [Candidatus Methylophosphatis haderslevensis]